MSTTDPSPTDPEGPLNPSGGAPDARPFYDYDAPVGNRREAGPGGWSLVLRCALIGSGLALAIGGAGAIIAARLIGAVVHATGAHGPFGHERHARGSRRTPPS